MRAHGEALRGHGVLPFHGLWETAKEWAERQSPRDVTFLFVVTLTAILGVGLIVYGFWDAFQTLEMSNLPEYWSVQPF